MELSELKDAFRQYTERMSAVRRLSSPDVRQFDSADSYSERLRHNFRLIGEMAAENRKMLDEALYPILEASGQLKEGLADELNELAELLLNVGGEEEFENLDLPIAAMIADRLLADANERMDLSERIRKMDAQMDVSYCMMNMTERIVANPQISMVYRDRGIALGEEFLSLLSKERFLTISDPECREIVLTDARFMTAFYERTNGDPAINERSLQLLDRMMDIAEDPFYHEAVPGFDWRYFKYRAYEYFVQSTEVHNEREFSKDQLDRICDRADEMERFCATDPAFFQEIVGYHFSDGGISRCRYLAGRMDRETYRKKLLSQYRARGRDDNSTSGMFDNIQIPLEFICDLDPADLTAEEVQIIKEFYAGQSAYLFRIPNYGIMSFLLEYFSKAVWRFVEVPSGVTFENFVLQCLAAIHPPTYIHSRMVGQITERLAYHLLRLAPEHFIGMPGCETLEEVLEQKEEIVSYAYHAALCHDFGKVNIIDTIFVYGRKLLDLEFMIIKSHPRMGYELLKKHASTRSYADVALGHHRWYDDTKGYPEDFRTSESPYKTVIDLVLCADCLDAATDTVGRSYNKGKTLADFLEELREGSGTRYAPWLVPLIEDEKVFQDVEYILQKGRNANYEETYELLREVEDRGQ